MGNINTVGPNEALVISGPHSCLYRGHVVVCGCASVVFLYLLQRGVWTFSIDPPTGCVLTTGDNHWDGMVLNDMRKHVRESLPNRYSAL